MEQLTNLKELDLEKNQITEIRGLDQLTNLEYLNLDRNPIRRDDELDVPGWGAQAVVSYCQEKAKKSKEGG